MIKHIVLLDLKPDHDLVELQAVMQGLQDFQPKLDGFTHFEHGPNHDFEGMSAFCHYGFICHFDNAVTSQAYLVHPDHVALGARLMAICNHGVAGITVIDLDLSKDGAS